MQQLMQTASSSSSSSSDSHLPSFTDLLASNRKQMAMGIGRRSVTTALYRDEVDVSASQYEEALLNFSDAVPKAAVTMLLSQIFADDPRILGHIPEKLGIGSAVTFPFAKRTDAPGFLHPGSSSASKKRKRSKSKRARKASSNAKELGPADVNVLEEVKARPIPRTTEGEQDRDGDDDDDDDDVPEFLGEIDSEEEHQGAWEGSMEGDEGEEEDGSLTLAVLEQIMHDATALCKDAMCEIFTLGLVLLKLLPNGHLTLLRWRLGTHYFLTQRFNSDTMEPEFRVYVRATPSSIPAYDPSIIVLCGFTYDPYPNGALQSVEAAAFEVERRWRINDIADTNHNVQNAYPTMTIQRKESTQQVTSELDTVMETLAEVRESDPREWRRQHARSYLSDTLVPLLQKLDDSAEVRHVAAQVNQASTDLSIYESSTHRILRNWPALVDDNGIGFRPLFATVLPTGASLANVNSAPMRTDMAEHDRRREDQRLAVYGITRAHLYSSQAMRVGTEAVSTLLQQSLNRTINTWKNIAAQLINQIVLIRLAQITQIDVSRIWGSRFSRCPECHSIRKRRTPIVLQKKGGAAGSEQTFERFIAEQKERRVIHYPQPNDTLARTGSLEEDHGDVKCENSWHTSRTMNCSRNNSIDFMIEITQIPDLNLDAVITLAKAGAITHDQFADSIHSLTRIPIENVKPVVPDFEQQLKHEAQKHRMVMEMAVKKGELEIEKERVKGKMAMKLAASRPTSSASSAATGTKPEP